MARAPANPLVLGVEGRQVLVDEPIINIILSISIAIVGISIIMLSLLSSLLVLLYDYRLS